MVEVNLSFRRALVKRLSTVLRAFANSLQIVLRSNIDEQKMFEKVHFKTIEGKLFFQDALFEELKKVGGVPSLAKADQQFVSDVGTKMLNVFRKLTEKSRLNYAPPAHNNFLLEMRIALFLRFIGTLAKNDSSLVGLNSNLITSVDELYELVSKHL
mgnify:CR=1 FL=1